MKTNNCIITLIITIFLISISAFNSRLKPFRGDKAAESCVACKFIWENVSEALNDNLDYLDNSKSSRKNPILISESFQYFCQISPDIFYDSCNNMFEKLFFLTEDFIAGKSFDEMCKKNDFC